MEEDQAPDNTNEGAYNEKTKIDGDNSVSVALNDLDDESKAQLIKSNGGAGDHVSVAIMNGNGAPSDEVSFNGLGKDEVLQYANDPFWVRLRWALFILFWVGWAAMLATAIIIIVVAPRCPPRPDMKWYQTDVIYQAYSKSFKDLYPDPVDGVGDFKGLDSKMKYIEGLGAKAVYINSVFKTAGPISDPETDLAIVDHKDLHPKFGTTVAAFKSWIKRQRKDGKKVILDLIPNQTSKNHTWFQKSASGDKDYKDYYVWAGVKSVPNNWKDIDGNTAWEFDSTRNDYYYHSFSKDLPDLNFNHEAVRGEIEGIMKFWFDAGVGGFYIQGLEYLVENPDISQIDDADQSQTRNYEGNYELLEKLRTIANGYSDKPGRERFLFGTVTHANENQTQEYFNSDKKKRLHMIVRPMDFAANCNADCLVDWLGPVARNDYPWLGLQLSSENTQRIADKLASRADPKAAIKIAHALLMLLPGTSFNYYGDEFGQKGGNQTNALNYRTPMQWNGQQNAGFTDAGVEPWIPVGQGSSNLEDSQAHFKENTVLDSFKSLVKLRGEESFQFGELKACSPNEDLLLFNRKATGFPYFLVLINTGEDAQTILLSSVNCVSRKKKGTVVFHSKNKKVEDELEFKKAVSLEAGDVVVIKFTAE